VDDQVCSWLRALDGRAGLPPADAKQAAANLGLPQDYVAFLREHDGAEGFIGKNYARFYGRADLVAAPDLDHLRDLVVFGSNGGGEAYAFDGDGTVVVVPWIGSRDDAIPQGAFEAFLRRLHDDRIYEQP
jgi:hypothetical protein